MNDKQKMKLHILGNGGPRPSSAGERFGTSCILEFAGERIMVDCGPGTTYKLARMRMLPTQINTVLLTHHHSDHIADFPCFALLRFDLDPGDLPALKVYGPAPTVKFADRLFGKEGAFKPDIIARQEHPVSKHGHLQRGGRLPRPGIKVEASDIESGAVIKGRTWEVKAVQVPHIEPYLITLAFRIDTQEGSVLFLCDAAECPAVKELAKGVDTFVTGAVGFNFKEDPSSNPIRGVSADISEVVDIAAGGNIPKIVLIHGSPLGKDFAAKLHKGYDGIIEQPDELTTLVI
jgi:ribonuclease Z